MSVFMHHDRLELASKFQNAVVVGKVARLGALWAVWHSPKGIRLQANLLKPVGGGYRRTIVGLSRSDA